MTREWVDGELISDVKANQMGVRTYSTSELNGNQTDSVIEGNIVYDETQGVLLVAHDGFHTGRNYGILNIRPFGHWSLLYPPSNHTVTHKTQIFNKRIYRDRFMFSKVICAARFARNRSSSSNPAMVELSATFNNSTITKSVTNGTSSYQYQKITISNNDTFPASTTKAFSSDGSYIFSLKIRNAKINDIFLYGI